MIRGGGDPNTAMALKPCPEWARRLGASPQKRIVASWSGSCMDPTEYKVAARASRPSVGSPRINYTEPRTTKDMEPHPKERGLGDLTRDPLRCRVGCQVDPDEISAIKLYDDEAIQQL